METTSARLALVPPKIPVMSAWSHALSVVRKRMQAFCGVLVARSRRRTRLLVLVESSSLGDRRFVSVVQFENQRFLIGSSPSSINLLARLRDADASAARTSASGSEEGGA